jgi:hypothetical protein
MISRMARFPISTVEVIAPDGTKSHWVVALPHSAAVAAVRKIIPPGHSAELSIRRFPAEGLRPGEVRKVERMTYPKYPRDRNQTVKSIIGLATGEPLASINRTSEYRVYAVGSDGHFVGCNEMICRDDGEAVAKAKRLASDSDIEIWNRSRFVIRLVHTPNRRTVRY